MADISLALAAIFSDGMVLQRDQPNRIWGRAAPASQVTIHVADQHVETEADDTGNWLIRITPPKQPGPHLLVVTSGDQRRTVANVWVGEVWYAAGQSNMEFALAEAPEGAAHATAARLPNLHFFVVPKGVHEVPQTELPGGQWVDCAAGCPVHLSAVAFYFARQLQAWLSVPVGIVVGTFPGTPIQAWMPQDTLAGSNGSEYPIDWGAQYLASVQEDQRRERRLHLPILDVQARRAALSRSSSPWVKTTYPLDGITCEWPYHDVVWLQKVFTVQEEVKDEIAFDFGHSFEADCVFLNGTWIGQTLGAGCRRYQASGSLLRVGTNTVLVRLVSQWRLGHWGAPGDRPTLVIKDGPEVGEIGGFWQYKTGTEGDFPALALPQHRPSGVYNAMLAPLANLTVKGVVWYQGESNSNAPDLYRDSLQLFIKQWRARGGEMMHFLIVQLPNIALRVGERWQEIREAQRAAECLPNVRVVPAVDLGDPWDLHPREKQRLGERLSLVARQAVYLDEGPGVGPRMISARRTSGGLTVQLSSYVMSMPEGSVVEDFEVEDSGGGWHSVKAVITGRAVHLSCPMQLCPTNVRYAWRPNPRAYLYDESAIPLMPAVVPVTS